MEIIVRIKRKSRGKLGDIRDKEDKFWEGKDDGDKVYLDKTEREVGKGRSEREMFEGWCFVERVS